MSLKEATAQSNTATALGVADMQTHMAAAAAAEREQLRAAFRVELASLAPASPAPSTPAPNVGYDFDGVVSLFLPLAFCNHELALGVPGHQCGARLMFTTPCTHLSAGKGLGLQVVSLGFTRAVEGFVTLEYPQGNSKRFGVLPEHDILLCPETQRASNSKNMYPYCTRNTDRG